MVVLLLLRHLIVVIVDQVSAVILLIAETVLSGKQAPGRSTFLDVVSVLLGDSLVSWKSHLLATNLDGHVVIVKPCRSCSVVRLAYYPYSCYLMTGTDACCHQFSCS